jgi:hypothetical protein
MSKIEAINLELERLHSTYRILLGYIDGSVDGNVDEVFYDQITIIEEKITDLHRILEQDEEDWDYGTDAMATLDTEEDIRKRLFREQGCL